MGIPFDSIRSDFALEQMEIGARLFPEYHNIDTFGGSDEFQTTTMFAIVSHWRQKFPEDFAVVHDASSNFLRSREMWERVTNANVPPQLHRGGDGSFVEFPLRVVSTTAVDSKDSRSIQFCDVLAGLADAALQSSYRRGRPEIHG